METISLREFQLKASDYLDKLPLILTRYNIPVVKVVPYERPDASEDIDLSEIETGFCEGHFEKGVEHPLIEATYEDANGTALWTKKLCPECIKKWDSQPEGKLRYE